MDSTNFVPPAIGTPAGPLSQANPPSQSGGNGKQIAAIVRPIPRESGKEGSLRLDPAQPGARKTHIRTNQLDDYVKWLRTKIKAKQAKTKPTSKSMQQATPTTAQPVTVTINPAALVTKTAQQDLSSDSLISTITTEADLTGHLEPATNRTEESSGRQHRIDPPIDSSNGLPSAHLNFETDTSEQVRNESTSLRTKLLTVGETEDFIAKVSQAIASILTDVPEPEFEQKVRAHFETELHARAIGSITRSSVESDEPVATADAIVAGEPATADEPVAAGEPTVSVDAVDQMDRAVLADLANVGGKPVTAMQSEADQVASEILHGAITEIPTSVAAWDVEDFRWPLVTNQMIVSGGEALNQLSQSTFELVAPSKQRIAIAGLGRGEGTTSIAISLARWSAACGKKVLLVDADLVTPGLSRQVGLAPNLSWINAVSQSLPPAEIIVRSQKSNLCIMPLAQMVSRVTWPRFIYDNLGEVISQVQNHFDMIILDVGPANQLLAELSRPGLLVDTAMVVHNGVNSAEFRKTKSRLEVFGINQFIVAQNRAARKTNVA